MQIADIRNKLNLHWRKISLALFFLLSLSFKALPQSQNKPINLSGQDNRFMSYGFFLAGHTSTLRMKYSDAFMAPSQTQLRQIQSITPVYSPGFALGFLLTLRLHDQFNFLATPKVGFYEYQTDINYFNTNDGPDSEASVTTETVITEATMIELPLIFKYKSLRFNNTRMFFIAGANPMFRTKSQDEADADPLVIKGQDVALEMGMGFDFYFKFFKFSPEIRFSHGLSNLYEETTSDPAFAGAIEDLRRKSITVYLNFQ